MSDLNDVMALLKKLDTKVDSLLKSAPPVVATESQMFGPYGDKKINFMPKSYKGDGSYKGMKMSECPSDFLDSYAETLEFMSNNPKEGADPKYEKYNRIDGSLARAWSRHNRSRIVASKPKTVYAEFEETGNTSDDLPF